MALDRDHRGRNVTNKTAYGTALSFATNVSAASPWTPPYAVLMNSWLTGSTQSSSELITCPDVVKYRLLLPTMTS